MSADNEAFFGRGYLGPEAVVLRWLADTPGPGLDEYTIGLNRRADGRIAFNGAQGPMGFRPDDFEAAIKDYLDS